MPSSGARLEAPVKKIGPPLPTEVYRNVRYWHLADVQTALMNVRFGGNNGHDADVTRCLLMTQSGHSTSLSAAGEGNLTRIRVVEAPQRAEDIFEFVGLFPSGTQHLHHPLQ